MKEASPANAVHTTKLKDTKGIILHGGKGTRLRPLTHTGPKQLIPIANKPVSQYVLEDLVSAGITDIAIVLGSINPERVTEHFGDGSRFQAKITYVYQGEPKGIAHAVGLCEQFARDSPFVVYLGDNMIKNGISRYVQDFVQGNYDAAFLLARVDDPRQYGVVVFGEDKNIIDVEEKPEKPKSNYVLTGVYFFSASIFDIIRMLRPSKRNELEITDAIKTLIKSGGYRIKYYYVDGWWDDTGSAEDILEANRYILDNDLKSEIKGVVEEGATIIGRIFTDENTIIKRGTVIRGPVHIGKSCEIGPNAYIGPYTAIGNRCIIRGASIEFSIILDNTRIECTTRIVDSLIGQDSEVLTREGSLPNGNRLIIGESSKVSFSNM